MIIAAEEGRGALLCSRPYHAHLIPATTDEATVAQRGLLTWAPNLNEVTQQANRARTQTQICLTPRSMLFSYPFFSLRSLTPWFQPPLNDIICSDPKLRQSPLWHATSRAPLFSRLSSIMSAPKPWTPFPLSSSGCLCFSTQPTPRVYFNNVVNLDSFASEFPPLPPAHLSARDSPRIQILMWLVSSWSHAVWPSLGPQNHSHSLMHHGYTMLPHHACHRLLLPLSCSSHW